MDEEFNSDIPALCCAICGPLSRREFSSAFPGVSFPVPKGNVFRLPEQPDINVLLTKMKKSPELSAACARIMRYRSSPAGNMRFMSESERCIAHARYALMTRSLVEFERMYRLYVGLNRVGLRPGMEMEDFWTGVLGPKWNGLQLVSYLKDSGYNLRDMLMSRYLLLPWPHEWRTVSMWHLPPEFELGIALLRANEAMRPDTAQLGDPIITQAYWSVWAGDWEHAYTYFRAIFRVKNDFSTIVRTRRNVGLLLMACISAIRAGTSWKNINSWLRVAREVIVGMLPAGDEHDVEIGQFFDMMLLWGAVVCNEPHSMEVPENITPFACLPLAMGAPYILRYSAISLPMNKLRISVVAARRRGLVQLARYAASGLMNIPSVDESIRKRFTRFIRKGTFAPLYADGEFVGQDAPRLGCLLDQALAQEETPREVLYWEIRINTAKTIQSITPYLLNTKKLYGAGKKLHYTDVMNSELNMYRDNRDAAIVGLLMCKDQMPKDNIHLYAQVLAGHPRLLLGRSMANRHPVTVSTHMPVIYVSQHFSSLRFTLNAMQLRRVNMVSRTEISLPYFAPFMKNVVASLCSGETTVNTSDVQDTRLLLATLSEYFELQGDIPPELLAVPDSECLVRVYMVPSGTGVRVQLRVVHSESSETFSVPGSGRRVLMIRMNDGSQQCIRRSPEQEKWAAQNLMNSCSELRELGTSRNFEWTISNRNMLLSLLNALDKLQQRVYWLPGDGNFSMVDAGKSLLTLSAQETMTGWLEIGAHLSVDEKMVYGLTKLLSQYDERQGLYLPLDARTCLRMSSELNQQLANLKELLRIERRRAVLPMAGIPALAECWQGELPDIVHHRYELMCRNSHEPIPAGLKATLREYQIEGFRWMVARARAGLGCCLADDMGLGKTVQVLALLLACASEGPSLVLAPLSVCSNWIEEAHRFTEGLRVLNYSDVRGDKMPELTAGDVVVASYGLLMSNETFFKGISWNVIVLDEAQYIKNPASQRFQAVCALQAAARVCLTGTPVENSLVDLWSIMEFLNPGLLGVKARYKRANDASQLRMRSLGAPLILRRTKSQVLPQLPPLTELRVGVELSAEERALYESCRRRALDQLRAGESHVQMLAQLMTLRRMCCHGKLALKSFRGGSSKITALVNLVEELRESGHKALVFSQFTDVLDLVQKALDKQKITTLRLDGSTTSSKREEQVKLFSEGKADVFLISLRAGGFGLNLTAADYVILMDPWWNPAVEAQAASRSHRMGQHCPVTVCRLIAKNTVEEKVIQMHDSKKLLAESVLESDTLPPELLRDILLSE